MGLLRPETLLLGKLGTLWYWVPLTWNSGVYHLQLEPCHVQPLLHVEAAKKKQKQTHEPEICNSLGGGTGDIVQLSLLE